MIISIMDMRMVETRTVSEEFHLLGDVLALVRTNILKECITLSSGGNNL
jgi:hypothetical protein